MTFEPAGEHGSRRQDHTRGHDAALDRALDVEALRRFFPSLTGKWTFFDNAGGAQVAQPVLDRLNEYLLTSNVQLGGSYGVSELATERVGAAAEAAATLVNASGPDEIIMGPSSTMLVRLLAESFGRALRPGDEIIVSNGDHETNIGPWVALEKLGATIKFWNVRPDTASLHLADLEPLLSDKTRLVAVTHVSNILGAINPIRAIAARVHDAGALVCVDGVAHAPHRAVDVQALDVDFYFFSFYKVYGPHYAMMYGRREHLLALPGVNHFFIDETDIPYKFQPGSVNYETAYATLGVMDYLRAAADLHGIDAALGVAPTRDAAAAVDHGRISALFEKFAKHEEALTARLLDFLAGKPNVRVIGPTAADRVARVATVSFRVDGADSADIVKAVDANDVGIRYGHFYSRRLIDALGLAPGNGVVRVSMVHYNTVAEVDRLMDVLDPLI